MGSEDDREARPESAEVADDTVSLGPEERAARDSGRTAPVDAPVAEPADPASARGPELPLGDPDRYQLLGEQGRGGLGRVVRARDRALGRAVAIKELATPAGEARFVREAKLTARLQHPGIVPVHEAGRWPGGEPYYVMKLISGRTLKELVRGRATLAERLALIPEVIAVAEAIGYAHSEGVIHRDIKPANVVIGEFGESVVVDWGLAKDLRSTEVEPVEEAGGGGQDTAVGEVLGTPAYMPPEQARGEEVTERADVYALGALLYEVLAGQAPYAGDDSHQVIDQVLAGPPPPLEQLQPGVPLDLIAIVSKATARDPAARYSTAKALADDLSRFQTGQLVTAHRYSRKTLLGRWLVRHRAVVASLSAGLLLVAVIGALSVRRVVLERNAAQRERLRAELRQDQLVLHQARTSLVTDPTATIAWLKALPAGAADPAEVDGMIDQAVAAGVARHVLRYLDWVQRAVFTSDGEWLAVASKDGNVRLWNVATAAARVLGVHPGGATTLALSAGDEFLATGGAQGTVLLWDLGDETSRVLFEAAAPVAGLHFSPNRERLLVLTEDGKARVLDRVSGQVLDSVKVGALAVSGDGRRLAMLTARGTIELRDENGTLTGTVAAPVMAELGAVSSLGLSHDGRELVCHGADQAVRLVDLERGTVRVLGHHTGRVAWIEFSRQDDRVAIAGDDGLAQVWDLVLGTGLVLRGHEDAIYQVTFSADGTLLASAGDDGTARLWNLATGDVHVLRGHDDDVVGVEFSPDGELLATASLDGTARLWSTRFDSGRVLRDPRDRVLRRAGTGRSPAGAIGDVVLCADGQIAISHSHDGELRIWEVATGHDQLLGQTELTAKLLPKRPPISRDCAWVAAPGPENSIRLWQVEAGAEWRLEHHRGAITSLEFSADGRSLLSAGADGDVVLWRLSDRTPRVVASGGPVWAATLSADGQRVAVANADRLAVLDAASGEPVTVLRERAVGVDGAERRLIESPDGAWLVVLGRTGEVAVWDLHNGGAQRLEAGGAGLTDLVFSNDSRFLAAAIDDRTIHLWESAGWSERVLSGHQDLVMDLAFSPDSTRLASASYDKTIRLWSLDGGVTRVLRGHAASVDAVAFAGDGSFLISGGRDATVRVWRLGPRRVATPLSVRTRLDALSSAEVGAGERLISNVGLR